MSVDIALLVASADRLVEEAGERLAAAGGGEVPGVMGWLVEAVEREVDGLPTSEEAGYLACGPGCSFCCIVNVSVLVPEAVAVAAHLRETMSADQLAVLSERVGGQAEKVRWVEDHERPLLRLPCSFLDERGWCRIHPVRPLMCRSVTSADSQACATLGSRQETVVVMHLPQKILCSMVFTGLAGVLQQFGLDCRSLELNRMVSNLLDRPALADDFVARKRLDFR